MSTKKRKVEIFTQGCPKCEDAVSLVKSLACDSCDVVVWDVNKGCATNECRDKVKTYGITQYPAIVVNGRLLDCCKSGGCPDVSTLKAAGIGTG